MSEQSLPLVTVVTPSYNSAEFIEETIHSVLNQTYPHIEYIVMDGVSTDGTVDILAGYEEQLTVVIEPDQGQSDAINKGWQRARGDIVAWLCADDLYLPDTVEKAVTALESNPDKAWVYGRSKWINREGHPLHFRAPARAWNYDALLKEANYIAQPTVFLRKIVLEQKGYLRNDLHYSMDYEYWLRIGKDYPPTFIDAPLSVTRYYEDTKSASGGFKRLEEYDALMALYGADELVHGYRYFWARSYLDATLSYLGAGNWTKVREYSKELFRYPGYVPRALIRSLLDRILPQEMQRQLRLLLLRDA